MCSSALVTGKDINMKNMLLIIFKSILKNWKKKLLKATSVKKLVLWQQGSVAPIFLPESSGGSAETGVSVAGGVISRKQARCFVV